MANKQIYKQASTNNTKLQNAVTKSQTQAIETIFFKFSATLINDTSRFYRFSMHSIDYAVTRCLSIRLSVRLSHTGIRSKRSYVSSNLATPSLFFITKRYGNTLTGTPLTGASNARDMKQSRFSTNIRFISEMIQDTMEGELEIVPKLSNGAVFNNLQWSIT